MHLRRLYFLLQSLLRIEQIWVTLYSLDMFKFAKLFISIFRESDSLKELIKEEKFEKVIDHCSELIKSTEDKDARDLAQLLRGTFYILSKQQDLAMSDLGVLIEDDSANSKIRANALIKRASLFIQQCKDPVQDPLKVRLI